jgi:hypothetical protein
VTARRWYASGAFTLPAYSASWAPVPPAELVAAELCFGTAGRCPRPEGWTVAAEVWARDDLGTWLALCHPCCTRRRTSVAAGALPLGLARITNRRPGGHVLAGLASPCGPPDYPSTCAHCAYRAQLARVAAEAAKYAAALTRAGHPPPPGWP